MEGIDPEQHKRVDRRTFLKTSLVAGGAVVGAGAAIRALADTGSETRSASPGQSARRGGGGSGAQRGQPNILVIVVDQLRYPQWFSANPIGMGLPPNMQRLREGGVSFGRHYTASNDCSPARSTLLTGLHTHQTGCMITGGSTLDPGFPTWGTLLRDQGYDTRWFGKWHLTHGDGHWTAATGEAGLEPYGFAGGVFPSPDGGPGQGWRVDPRIANRFTEWFDEEGHGGPWCTTVSFVNPHDIAWWYIWSDRVPAEATAQRTVRAMPPNYETPELLIERGKPRLQRSLQETASVSFGPVPFTGPESTRIWIEFLDLYTKLQRRVDGEIGRVLNRLERRPDVAANTVILFTSDHGEYGASHGLRGKGAAAYEEGIRVPLIVKDPRGKLTKAPATVRTQLTSSVDVVPLILTIATGSDTWRGEAQHAHLAGRADLAGILADPSAQGRDYVLHATDETVTEFAVEPYAADAPLHVVAVRTAQAKLALYSDWSSESTTPLSSGQEGELYDYSTQSGRLELHNSLEQSPLEGTLRRTYEQAFRNELREPLPLRLEAARSRGITDYFSTAKHAAAHAASRRRERDERIVASVPPSDELRTGQKKTPPARRHSR